MLSLLEMSAAGGVLVLAVVVVRALAMNRLPKTALAALWAVALARLLLPVRVPFPGSFWAAASALPELPRRTGVLVAGPSAGAAVAEAGAAGAPWGALWAAGAAALALLFLSAHLRARWGYMASLPAQSPFVKQWSAQHPLRRPLQVRVSDEILSPLTYGVLRPVILLPRELEEGDAKTVAFVLEHELAHVRRFDALTKWLLAAVLCLHWFNPLVWAMYVLAGRDLELACDEAVVRQYGREARAPYALALVGMAEQHSGFTPLASGFSKNALTERITAIMRARPVTAFGAGAALMLVVGVTVLFATSAPARQQKAAGAAQGGAVTLTGDFVRGAAAGTGTAQNSWGGGYTQQDYDRLVAALGGEGYAQRPIAEFNRAVYAAFTQENTMELYERILMALPEEGAQAAFLRNTVQASLNEYTTRLSEVYSGERSDPEFSGRASVQKRQTLFDRQVGAEVMAEYRFTYRILDQDGLTVAGRDAFLQSVMQAAQAALEHQAGQGGDEASLRKELQESGAALSNEQIEFTGCTIDWLDVSGDY